MRFLFLNKLIHFVSTFRNTAYVEYGPGFFNLCKKFYYSLLKINKFIVLEFNGLVSDPLSGASSAFLTVYDFSLLDKYRNNSDSSKALFCDKIHLVKRCHIIEIDNKLACILWLYSKGDYSRFIKLDAGMIEINNLLTLPLFREKKLAEKLLRESTNMLWHEGYRKIVAVVHEQNIASIKSFTRAGFVKINEVRSFGPFNRKISV